MTGKIKAVVFDWAGTVIDFGSRAPVIALCRLFGSAGVPISEAEVRTDMGLAKRDHIATLLVKPRIHDAWLATHGAAPSSEDIDRLFAAVGQLIRDATLECAQLVPGVAELVEHLRLRGIRIGSCTGYSREMMTGILPIAARQGFEPDCLVCAGETLEGRPSPLMLWKNLIELGVWPASSCVKVDDTEAGMAEGRAAGAWSIGVAASGNIIGLGPDALAALPKLEMEEALRNARTRLAAAGAHAVIDTVADLVPVIDRIEAGEEFA